MKPPLKNDIHFCTILAKNQVFIKLHFPFKTAKINKNNRMSTRQISYKVQVIQKRPQKNSHKTVSGNPTKNLIKQFKAFPHPDLKKLLNKLSRSFLPNAYSTLKLQWTANFCMHQTVHSYQSHLPKNVLEFPRHFKVHSRCNSCGQF